METLAFQLAFSPGDEMTEIAVVSFVFASCSNVCFPLMSKGLSESPYTDALHSSSLNVSTLLVFPGAIGPPNGVLLPFLI